MEEVYVTLKRFVQSIGEKYSFEDDVSRSINYLHFVFFAFFPRHKNWISILL